MTGACMHLFLLFFSYFFFVNYEITFYNVDDTVHKVKGNWIFSLKFIYSKKPYHSSLGLSKFSLFQYLEHLKNPDQVKSKHWLLKTVNIKA